MFLFILGLFIGMFIGVAAMCFLRVAHEDENNKDLYEVCRDCKYRNLHAWDEPCDICDGDKYEPMDDDDISE